MIFNQATYCDIAKNILLNGNNEWNGNCEK